MQIISCPNCGAKNRVDERRVKAQQPVCGRCGTKLSVGDSAAASPLEVTDASFTRVVLEAPAELPVLVDCWAEWCGPCRMIGPTIDELARESQGRYLVGKLNVDENQATASRYQISSIPALLIFKGGKLQEQLVGVQPKPVIAGRLEALLR